MLVWVVQPWRALLIRTLAHHSCAVREVVRDYDLPPYVGEQTLLIAASLFWQYQETVAAAILRRRLSTWGAGSGHRRWW